jgi:hypothetical protein
LCRLVSARNIARAAEYRYFVHTSDKVDASNPCLGRVAVQETLFSLIYNQSVFIFKSSFPQSRLVDSNPPRRFGWRCVQNRHRMECPRREMGDIPNGFPVLEKMLTEQKHLDPGLSLACRMTNSLAVHPA